MIDFGISRAIEASALTHTGLVVGSPGFMSPEQAEGRIVGPPSDIFSLGAVLAFAATGQGPFGTGSTPALVYRVVHSPPNLDYLPAEIRPLVERCLAKDPAHRPTAAQLLTGAAYPATGWLPEPVSQRVQPKGQARGECPADSHRGSAGGGGTGAAAGPAADTACLAAGGRRWCAGRLRLRVGRHPGRGRWRLLTAAAILAGLVGAGVTTGVMMTARTTPAHAAQSCPAGGRVRAGADLSADLRSSLVRVVIPSVTAAPRGRSAPAYTPGTPPGPRP